MKKNELAFLATRITDGAAGSDEIGSNPPRRRCARGTSNPRKLQINNIFPSVFPVAFTSDERYSLELSIFHYPAPSAPPPNQHEPISPLPLSNLTGVPLTIGYRVPEGLRRILDMSSTPCTKPPCHSKGVGGSEG